MEEKLSVWHQWADDLCRWGVQDFISVFLDALGPFSVVLGEILYVFQPFLKPIMPGRNILYMADLLTDPSETTEFLELIRSIDG